MKVRIKEDIRWSFPCWDIEVWRWWYPVWVRIGYTSGNNAREKALQWADSLLRPNAVKVK